MAKPRPGRVPKRLRTRDALLRAAQELLMEKTAEEISIRQITDRADVVHATFYNYYPSPAAAFEAVNILLLATYGRVVESVVKDIDDPVERVAASGRQTMKLIVDNPRLGRLLFDSGLAIDPLMEGMRARMTDDIRRGEAAGKLEVRDLNLVVSAAVGMGLGIAMDLHRGRLKPNSIEGFVKLILGLLGVPPDAAEEVVHRPIHYAEMPDFPLSLVAESERALAG